MYGNVRTKQNYVLYCRLRRECKYKRHLWFVARQYIRFSYFFFPRNWQKKSWKQWRERWPTGASNMLTYLTTETTITSSHLIRYKEVSSKQWPINSICTGNSCVEVTFRSFSYWHHAVLHFAKRPIHKCAFFCTSYQVFKFTLNTNETCLNIEKLRNIIPQGLRDLYHCHL